MKKFFLQLSIFLSILSMISFSFYPFASLKAASLVSAKNTMSRLEQNITSNHTFSFTLPTGVDFDSTGNIDILRVDFPAGFTLGGTWVVGDFSFNDGIVRTVESVNPGPSFIDCTVASGPNNVCVAIDTTNNIFSVKPSSTYVASGTAATVTFTINGVSPNGTITNPNSTGSQSIEIAMCDETAGCTSSFVNSHNTSVAVGIADSDRVTVTATVNSSLTFDLDVGPLGSEDTNAPYSVPLGTLSVTDVTVSGSTDGVNRIMMDLNTNAGSGVIVTVQNANGSNGLVSGAGNIPSATAAMVAGTANYGLCVISVTASIGTLSKAGSYTGGTCAADSNTNNVFVLTTSGENIVSSAGPLSAGRAQVAVNAAISGVTPAATDYSDTLTFIATSTF